MAARTRVGVVGCGLIAQVMHLPYLAELSDRFEIAAVCDLSETVAAACAERFGVPRVLTRWEELVTEPLDAVLIASSGDHAPPAIAAAQAGLHILVEKPMALSSPDAARMAEAARRAGVCLMVGTMKRYDPAYERLAEQLGKAGDVRLVRVTTLESPFEPYVAHHPLHSGAGDVDAELVAALRARDDEIVAAALPDSDEETRWCHRWILLDSLVHELNALRGVLGDPTEIVSASLTRQCVVVHLRFGETECQLSWVDLPGIARYRQEFAFYAPDRRLTLQLPSPFLRNAPSRLITEGGEPGTAESWERDELIGYDEAFRRELVEFAGCIETGRAPRTAGTDAFFDVLLCELISEAHTGGGPVVMREEIAAAPGAARR